MKRALIVAALLLTSIVAEAKAPIKLFNGKNLDGWSIFTKSMSDIPTEVFSVKDKAIDLTGEMGYIYTNEQYSNYSLSLEWRWVGEASNSGIFLNMQGDNMLWPSCYEIQLLYGCAGDMYNIREAKCEESIASGSSKSPALNSDVEKSVGEWNKVDIVSTPSVLTIYINGIKQNELHNLTQPSGHIGFQSEAKGLQFRNIVLTPLE